MYKVAKTHLLILFSEVEHFSCILSTEKSINQAKKKIEPGNNGIKLPVWKVGTAICKRKRQMAQWGEVQLVILIVTGYSTVIVL